jgi:hypothetical protein
MLVPRAASITIRPCASACGPNIAGAEEDSRRSLGRGLSAEELERVLGHYPGD